MTSVAKTSAVLSRTAIVYRIRIKSSGAAHRKGAWILYRDSFTDFTEACKAAKALAPLPCGGLVRITTGTSVKALAEFAAKGELT